MVVEGQNNSRAVHFDAKTATTLIIAALTLSGGLILWGANIQERVGVVEQQQETLADAAVLRHSTLSARVDLRANMTEREISRIEGRFDKLDKILFRIEDKLDRKADRNGD